MANVKYEKRNDWWPLKNKITIFATDEEYKEFVKLVNNTPRNTGDVIEGLKKSTKELPFQINEVVQTSFPHYESLSESAWYDVLVYGIEYGHGCKSGIAVLTKLGLSNTPSWYDSGWFRKKLENGINIKSPENIDVKDLKYIDFKGVRFYRDKPPIKVGDPVYYDGVCFYAAGHAIPSQTSSVELTSSKEHDWQVFPATNYYPLSINVSSLFRVCKKCGRIDYWNNYTKVQNAWTYYRGNLKDTCE